MSETPSGKIQFHYLKSSQYRVIHADGAVGGLTPRGHVFFSLYSERPPIPEAQVFPLSEQGRLGDEIVTERRSKRGVVREVEVGISMDLDALEAFHAWMSTTLAELRTALQKGVPK